ncbi:MerR family transcriptional regulator [Streptomyces lavendulae]|uniref:MerR family transcriptional regulator n=1 Tax=Streptomyces lavendulae TaxID=1914 RepID=UPI0024A450E8|nr:MerR family transcriptional regulator [Streptomyces lavendulae]GLX23195.1 transcriptional regulator [Streptomyces lavendulae subsp. lavendulae]GLX30657.1 transcriptional regulator [Streptomyces lavendulae subsp. lavendulae]
MSETGLGVTTGAVARRLGVSPTTVRSWEQRYGIGPEVREGGRHRRWTPGDIAMLEEMCRLTSSGIPPAEAARAALAVRSRLAPEARAASSPRVPQEGAEPLPGGRGRSPRGGPGGPGGGLPLGEVRQECRGLARAAVRLDGAAMDALLRQTVEAHGLVVAWEEVMVPTLHAVGRKWESTDDRYVEVEHLLSWHVSTVLRRAAVSERGMPAHAAPVVLACLPGEQHTLPLEALAAGLAERGVPTRMFGAAVPAEALRAAVARSGPMAVVLWSQSRSTADSVLARQVASTAFGLKGARTAPLVLLAGPGWSVRAAVGGMRRPRGLREALDAVSALYPDARAEPVSSSR